MITKRKVVALLLFSFILISSISLISAVDSNTTDLDAVDDDVIELEQDGLDESVQSVDDGESELGLDSNQEVLSDGGYKFSDLNTLINSSESLEITLPHYYNRVLENG